MAWNAALKLLFGETTTAPVTPPLHLSFHTVFVELFVNHDASGNVFFFFLLQ